MRLLPRFSTAAGGAAVLVLVAFALYVQAQYGLAAAIATCLGGAAMLLFLAMAAKSQSKEAAK